MEHTHAEGAHHEDPGILGGLLDGTAVGLGASMFIGGLFTYNHHLSPIEWFGIVGVCSLLGAIGGSIWGRKRGY